MTNKEELFIEHVFDAPQEVVFEAWTGPQQLVHWYAPDGCTIEFRHVDVREGGQFHSCIYDPVHGNCWIKGVYHQVVFPSKLVYSMALTNEAGEDVSATTAGKPDEWPPSIFTTVTFHPMGTKTRVTLHQTVAEAEAKKTGAYQSWFKMFYRLNTLLTIHT